MRTWAGSYRVRCGHQKSRWYWSAMCSRYIALCNVCVCGGGKREVLISPLIHSLLLTTASTHSATHSHTHFTQMYRLCKCCWKQGHMFRSPNRYIPWDKCKCSQCYYNFVPSSCWCTQLCLCGCESVSECVGVGVTVTCVRVGGF